MTRTAFVTGGTGFIGINLIRQLTEEGWKVTVLHRPSSNLQYLQNLPIDLVEGSITDEASLHHALPKETEVVFHLAGSTNQWSCRNAEQTAINVEGTRNVVNVARQGGVTTFIHTSSMAAWGNVKGRVDEETPQRGGRSWINYERTKWAGEKEALKASEEEMKVVILNPAAVVGPYDTKTWGRIFFLIRDRKLPGIPMGDINLAHVREVARAHIEAVDKGRHGERYILGGELCNYEEIVWEVIRLMNIKKKPRLIPAPVLKGWSHLLAFAAYFTGKEPDITPEMAHIVTRQGVHFSSRKAIKQLNYRIPPWESAFRDCHRWMVEEGIL